MKELKSKKREFTITIRKLEKDLENEKVSNVNMYVCFVYLHIYQHCIIRDQHYVCTCVR